MITEIMNTMVWIGIGIFVGMMVLSAIVVMIKGGK